MNWYFKKHLQNRRFENPLELQKYIEDKKKGISSLVKTARLYLNYCEKFDKLPFEVVNKYRQFLKVPYSNPDVYVPTDSEVIIAYNKIKGNSVLEIVFLVLMTSGIRYIECLDFLKNYNIDKFTVCTNFVAYRVSNLRHTKNINNIYLPLFVYTKLKQVTNTYNALRQRFKEKQCSFSLKYLRKWHYNFLLYNNVPESVADFIQGRSNRSVSANHYLARSQQADFWYSKVVPELDKLFK